MQDGNGNFIPYTGYQYNRGVHSSLFPRDSQGRFILPTNARGEKAFPVDTNNMPIFPFDTTTHLPTFPVDENGQPVFPTGALGRPIVPIDTNGNSFILTNLEIIFSLSRKYNPVLYL